MPAPCEQGDLWLPETFEYQVVPVQGTIMSDGNPVPGIFDGMAAYPGNGGATILIRNHENRQQSGETKVLTPDALQYDTAMRGGNTKLVVRRRRRHETSPYGNELYAYEVEREFAILAGTSANCAGGTPQPALVADVRGGREADGRHQARLRRWRPLTTRPDLGVPPVARR